jgi:hypothetical protein
MMTSDERTALADALVSAAQAIRTQADVRFDDDGAKAIGSALLSDLTEAVEAVEAIERVHRHDEPAAPSPDRAALVERMLVAAASSGAERIFITPTRRGLTLDEWTQMRLAAMDRALRAIEAAGWEPRPEPITEEEIESAEQSFIRRVYWDEDSGRDMVMLMIHALPERHRRLVLGE